MAGMLELIGLTRDFGDLRAVDNVSFSMVGGKVTGFVGGNGAGKTTTMRMIMGLLEPTSGEVLWEGKPITTQIRRDLGYMPEERGLYPKQSVISQLTFLGELHGMSKADAAGTASELLTRFGLADRAKDKLESLSLGNQQRVQITAAILPNPIGLILDEPFSGLDPDAVDDLFGVLGQYLQRGIPVLFSSHQLDLVERLANQVVVLAKGKVVAKGTVSDLREAATHRHRLVASGDLLWLDGSPWVEELAVSGDVATFQLASESAAQALLSEALSRTQVREFGPIIPTLSDIYRGVAK